MVVVVALRCFNTHGGITLLPLARVLDLVGGHFVNISGGIVVMVVVAIMVIVAVMVIITVISAVVLPLLGLLVGGRFVNTGGSVVPFGMRFVNEHGGAAVVVAVVVVVAPVLAVVLALLCLAHALGLLLRGCFIDTYAHIAVAVVSFVVVMVVVVVT